MQGQHTDQELAIRCGSEYRKPEKQKRGRFKLHKRYHLTGKMGCAGHNLPISVWVQDHTIGTCFVLTSFLTSPFQTGRSHMSHAYIVKKGSLSLKLVRLIYKS